MAGTIQGASAVNRAMAANPLSVAGGVFVTTQEMAKKITTHFDASSVPDAVTLKAIGYLTDEGPKRTISQNTTQHKAWGGDTLLITREGAEAEVTIPCAEYLNPVGHRALYGDANVTWDNTKKILTIQGKLNNLPPHVAIVILVDTDSATGVIVYDDAQAVIDGEISMDGKSITALPLKFALRPVNGVFYREYWKADNGVELGITS